MKSRLTLILPLGCMVVLAGCQSYTKQSASMSSAWQAGNGAVAASEATTKAEDAAGSKDELLWRLEQGTVLSTIGERESGLEAFDIAEDIVNRYEEEAKVKLTSETASLLTNQAARPYRGRAYEKIMMNTYKALDYLILSDEENARIELNRAFQRQEDAVYENQKKIEEAMVAAEQSKNGELEGEEGKPAPSYDVDRAKQDPQFSSATDAEMARVDARILPYADYVNPFSVFLDGMFFSHRGIDNADMERARKSFERVKGMSPGSYILQDYQMSEAMANGAPADTVTYVIFSTGSAPIRDELRIDIPLFLISDVSYIGASFPRLEYRDRYIPKISAFTTGGESYTTELVCSMDSVISKDFKNEWPTILTKTLLTTATKAIAGKAVEDSVGNDWKARLIAKAANIGFQSATNKADVRSWTTLPKEFSYLRMPTPVDGTLTLRIGMYDRAVSITPGATNVVMVRSVNDTAQPIISQFILN